MVCTTTEKMPLTKEIALFRSFISMLYEVSYNSLLIAYALGKDFVCHSDKHRPLSPRRKACSVLFAIIILTIYLLISPLILLYLCIDILLKFKHRELYGGLLNGLDLVFEMRAKKVVINVIMIFSTKDKPSILLEKLQHCAYRLHESCYKFGSHIRHMLGYRYYLKNQVNFDKIVNIVSCNSNEYMTREDLVDYLEINCSTIKENQLWKAIFFTQPIRWNVTKKEDKQIAAVLSFRHAIGDFPSILGFIKRHFRLEEVITTEPITYDIQEDTTNLGNVCVLRNPFTFFQENIPWAIPHNLNHHIAVFCEDRMEYIPKIRKIKRNMNVTFVEVLSAAISSSVCEYAARRKLDFNELTMATVVRPNKEDIAKIITRKYNFDKLSNRSGAFTFNVPVKSSKESIKHRLMDIHNYNESLLHSVDSIILFKAGLYVGTFLPAGLASFLCKLFLDDIAVIISNVVGLSNSRCCGETVDEIFFCAPGFLNTGFSFFINSYGERIQIAAISKEGYVHNREELQNILRNVFINIDLLQKEISKE